jgi:S-adenosylmethionine hydrolase
VTRPSGVITLLTDFGLRDPFVGMMKGVILARFPAARLVDLTHEIRPQDVRAAAYWLTRSYRGFAPGTVHVAVVDPGVGTARKMLVIEAGAQCLLAPDNGLLAEIAATHGVDTVHAIDLQACGVGAPSHTFHGRDVLAPVAAELAAGRLTPERVGPSATLTARGGPLPRVAAGCIEGTVVVCDRFGNLLTDIPSAAVARLGGAPAAGDPAAPAPVVWIGEQAVPWRRTYAEVSVGELVAVDNAHGDVEIARREGSAAEWLGLGPGTPVRVVLAPAPGNGDGRSSS